MTWVYGEDGKLVERCGVKYPRPLNRHYMLPCHSCPKIPGKVKHWRHAIELTERNWMAYIHWKGCQATGKFPDDSIVTRNAIIISEEAKSAEQVPLNELLYVLVSRIGEGK